jgi:PAS domain S-box-containing protein
MQKLPSGISYNQEDKFLNALAEAYRLQEAIIGATELAIISTRLDGIITSFNRAAEIQLGYSAEEVVGKLTPVVFHDLDEMLLRSGELSKTLGRTVEPGFDALIAYAQAKSKPDRREWNYVRKDGTRFPVVLSITCLRDDQGTITGYVGIATNITEQKRMNKRAESSEAHLQALLSSIEDIVYEVKLDGTCVNVFCSEQDTTHLLPEVIGKPITSQFDGAYHEVILRLMREVLGTGETRTLEYKHNNRWYNARFSLVYNESPANHRISISSHDITERKAIEGDLKDSEQKFRLLAENIPGVIYLCNNDEHYSMIYLNDPVLEMTGYTKEEFMDHRINFTQLYHPDDSDRVISLVTEALKFKRSFHIAYRILHKSGEIRWLEEYGVGVYDSERLLFIEGFISDITRRKNAEQELIQSKNNLESLMSKLQEQNRQLDEFAHIISHNIRGPVGNINALISFLDEKSSRDDYRLIFDKIRNVSVNLNETMNEIMDTLQIKKNARIERQELRFKDILDKVIQSLEGNLIQSGASVTYDFQAPVVYYPKSYLESILQNLLSNAIKYRSPDRSLEVHFSTQRGPGGTPVLSVRDNGSGIDMKRFGDKLFGLHKTFHDHKEARGVGLFLTKTQVETLGGIIRAESEPGMGTTFIIEF